MISDIAKSNVWLHFLISQIMGKFGIPDYDRFYIKMLKIKEYLHFVYAFQFRDGSNV